MFITPFFRFGVPQDAPTLTITTGSSDNTPGFITSGDLALGDTVRFSYSTDSGFSGASEVTNTIDAAEDAANALSFATGSLANGTWYFRDRVERPPRGITAWSNTETLTINVSGEGGPISLFGRWLGGFANPGSIEGGPISLFGRWLGGFGSTAAVVVTPPPVVIDNGGVGGPRKRPVYVNTFRYLAAKRKREQKELDRLERLALERARALELDSDLRSIGQADKRTAQAARSLEDLNNKIAHQIEVLVQLEADIEMAEQEEEEAIMLLLLH